MPSPNTTRAYYSINAGGAYVEFPVPFVSAEPPQGATENINRGHLNATKGLQLTSPGNRQCGKATLHFEWDSRVVASFDFLQLVAAWWEDRTEALWFKIEWPKTAAHTTPPKSVFVGYIDQQPFAALPEEGRMMLDLQIQLTSEVTNTDGAA